MPAGAINVVAADDVGQNGGVIVVVPPRQAIAQAAAGALFGRGHDVELQRRVGHDHGADVAANHDHPPAPPDSALPFHHPRPNTGHGRHLRHGGVYFRPAQIPGDVLAVEPDGVLPAVVFVAQRQHVEVNAVGQGRQRRLIVQRHVVANGGQRQRAIHAAGIEVEIAQAQGQKKAQR